MPHYMDTILEIFWSHSLIFLHPPTILSLHFGRLSCFSGHLSGPELVSNALMLRFLLALLWGTSLLCSNILCARGSKGLVTYIKDAALLRRVGVDCSATPQPQPGHQAQRGLLLRRTAAEAAALLPQCGSWELNSGHQAWWQEPLPSEPPRWPQLYNLIWYAEAQ